MDKNFKNKTLKILTYNIQVGIPMEGAHHYIFRAWRHFFPHMGRLINLKKIGEILKNYDLVGLQEVDAGSMRSSFINQISYLAKHAGFLSWEAQVNRNLKFYAQHANGLLSRYPLLNYKNYRLPGRIPGRGVMVGSISQEGVCILVLVAHLSLTAKTQKKQLIFISELIKNLSYKHVIVMGDLNLSPDLLEDYFLKQTGLISHAIDIPTYPSWKPTKKLDYVLTSPSLKIIKAEVLPLGFSDHLPVAVEILWPVL